MKLKVLLLLAAALLIACNSAFCEGKVIFGFENNAQGWAIPDWALEKEDYKAQGIKTSGNFVKEGVSALELSVNFTDTKWQGAYIEIEPTESYDWSAYSTLLADVYLPKDAPLRLESRFILTVGEGDDWIWTEMNSSTKLVPGEWNTVKANIAPGSTDWKKIEVTDKFRANVRKVGLRIESKTAYSGPVYIDNIRVQ